MSCEARAGTGASQNCLHLLDVGAMKTASELWLLHHDQWSQCHSTIIETFKVITQIGSFLDQFQATLLRLKTPEAIGHALPRTWELLSRMASNIALLVHRDVCEKLLKCIDIFVSEARELTTETRRRAHDWATRLLHGIAKVLDQINDLSRWEADCGQAHYDMADLIKDPREWVACEQSYVVIADNEPRDLTYLLDTCLLFMHLQRPSGILTHVLACVSKLPDVATPSVTAFLDQADAILSKTRGCQGDFWSTIRARLWECQPVSFETSVIRFAKCCIKDDHIRATNSGSFPCEPVDPDLVQACCCSFSLCYRAVMMLRQLSMAACGSHLADMPFRCFHLALKERMYALGEKAPFDLRCIYAGWLSEAASIATVPVTAYRSADALSSCLRRLATAVAQAVREAASSTQPSQSAAGVADEVRCLFVEQCDWYWAAVMTAAGAASTGEAEHVLDIMVLVQAAATSPFCWSPEVLSDLQKQKSEICRSLDNVAMLDWPAPVKAPSNRSSTDRVMPPVIVHYAGVLDMILLLRGLVSGSSQHVTATLCRLSPSSVVRLGILLHVLRMIDIEYWMELGVLSCASLQCLKTVLDSCVKTVCDSCLGATDADGTVQRAILSSGELYIDAISHKLALFTQHPLIDLDKDVATFA